MDEERKEPRTPSKRSYPPFYERAIPVALGIIILGIAILIVVILAVLLGWVPGGG
ncbi:MAG TPA: hypothetical protein G4O00_14695 [Thermoflexia bacterium]|jgi:hypothetical protein|nr:hypothetical protein [Thermoflexia bacterium]